MLKNLALHLHQWSLYHKSEGQKHHLESLYQTSQIFNTTHHKWSQWFPLSAEFKTDPATKISNCKETLFALHHSPSFFPATKLQAPIVGTVHIFQRNMWTQMFQTNCFQRLHDFRNASEHGINLWQVHVWISWKQDNLPSSDWFVSLSCRLAEIDFIHLYSQKSASNMATWLIPPAST